MERKTYQITDQNIALIEAVKKEHPELKSDSAAMRFILTEYERERKRNTTEAEMRLIRIVQKEMEDKVNRLYDAVNTILIKNKEEVCFRQVIWNHRCIKNRGNTRKRCWLH